MSRSAALDDLGWTVRGDPASAHSTRRSPRSRFAIVSSAATSRGPATASSSAPVRVVPTSATGAPASAVRRSRARRAACREVPSPGSA